MQRCQHSLPFHENEGIILLWSILRADLEEESAGVLLQMVVNQWVKIRGFSFSSCWAEKCKAAQRKMTQVKGCPKTAASQPDAKKVNTDSAQCSEHE